MQRETIDYSEHRASNQAPYQLFLFDPNSIKIELNFEQRSIRIRSDNNSSLDLSLDPFVYRPSTSVPQLRWRRSGCQR